MDRHLDTDGPILFETSIRPYRSASRRALRNFGIVLGAASAVAALLSAIFGAWVVAIFSLLTSAAALLAIINQAKIGKTEEIITLREFCLYIKKINRYGQYKEYSYNPHFLNVALTGADGAIPKLVISHYREKIEIASILGNKERAELHLIIQELLNKIKEGYFTNK